MSTGDEEVEFVGELIDKLFLGLRTVSLYGPQHGRTDKVVGELEEALADVGPPYALQFVDEALFRDRRLPVPVGVERFKRLREICEILNSSSIHELVVDDIPSCAELKLLCEALGKAKAGDATALEGLRISGVSFRDIPEVRRSQLDDDPDLMAVTQLGLAVADTEQILRSEGGSWPFSMGLGVVRRLERAMLLDPDATARALETAPAPWTRARRAVSATHHVVRVLSALGVSRATSRSAGHAMLALTLQGLQGDRVPPPAKAADAALRHLLDAPAPGTPHRLRVCTILHQLGEGGRIGLAVEGLMTFAYAVEAARLDPDGRPRSLAELLARVRTRRDLEPVWVRAASQILGPLPPGTCVRTPTGRVGLVVGAGQDDDEPWQPQVEVSGGVQLWPAWVEVLSPSPRRRRTSKRPRRRRPSESGEPNKRPPPRRRRRPPPREDGASRR